MFIEQTVHCLSFSYLTVLLCCCCCCSSSSSSSSSSSLPLLNYILNVMKLHITVLKHCFNFTGSLQKQTNRKAAGITTNTEGTKVIATTIFLSIPPHPLSNPLCSFRSCHSVFHFLFSLLGFFLFSFFTHNRHILGIEIDLVCNNSSCRVIY